jgi:signal transduction histidine kinase
LAEAHRRLGETASARDQALLRLQAAARDREVFLESVAHDLKTPLTVIKGNTDLLITNATSSKPLEPARIVSGLNRIAAGTRQLAAMAEELQWLARLDIDRSVEMRREPTDLVALARHAVEECAATAPDHGLLFESTGPTLVGLWDPARLERVVANLLSNAIKYSPAGGGVRVSVSPEDLGGTAVLVVADTGVGIPAADLPHVFERFYRAENVGSHIPGSGLGLASVRQVVEGLGGTVEIVSQEGAGTTVTIRIPTEPPGAPSTRSTAS